MLLGRGLRTAHSLFAENGCSCLKGDAKTPRPALRASLSVDAFSGRVRAFRLCEAVRVRVGADVVLTFCNAYDSGGGGGGDGCTRPAFRRLVASRLSASSRLRTVRCGVPRSGCQSAAESPFWLSQLSRNWSPSRRAPPPRHGCVRTIGQRRSSLALTPRADGARLLRRARRGRAAVNRSRS